MPLSHIKEKLKHNMNLSPSYGQLIKVMQNMFVANGVKPSVGDIVKIIPSRQNLNAQNRNGRQIGRAHV